MSHTMLPILFIQKYTQNFKLNFQHTNIFAVVIGLAKTQKEVSNLFVELSNHINLVDSPNEILVYSEVKTK